MATDKRERQRQNRAVKQVEQSKQQRRQKVFELAKRIAIWAIAFLVLLVLANLVWG
jgi:ABC-type Fe3+ transport system permease subunit